MSQFSRGLSAVGMNLVIDGKEIWFSPYNCTADSKIKSVGGVLKEVPARCTKVQPTNVPDDFFEVWFF